MHNKPPTTFEEQVQILKSRGLKIPDETKAIQFLQHHNYYRLSAYKYPFVRAEDANCFLPDTTFEQLVGLYYFDAQLRLLVNEAIKNLEISVRTKWAYVLGHSHGAQSFEDGQYFRNQLRHKESLEKIDEELKRSDEDFVKHFREKYGMARPPVWAVCEVLTLGSLSRLYENLASDKIRKQIAEPFELSAGLFTSLLRHTTYIRNICAHHARLWNRSFTITVQLPYSRPKYLIANLNPDQDRKLYNTLVLLVHIQNVIDPANSWRSRIFSHLDTLNSQFSGQMGCPEKWKSLPLWECFSKVN